MAHLQKPTTTSYVNAAGRRVPKGTPGAKAVVTVSKKWYAAGVPGWPKGKRVPLAEDKRVAQKMLADLVEKAERGAVGLPAVSALAVELEPLVVEYGEVIARESGEKHVKAVLRNVRRVLAACGLRTLADLMAGGVGAKAERFVWSQVGDMTSANAAYIGKHAKQFARWLHRKKELIDRDPFAGIDLPSQDATVKRRALTAEELAKLIQAAAESPVIFRDLTGPERAVLYSVAVTTGFRAAELAALTASSFDLLADPPTVSLLGAHTKNSKDARLPVASGVARQLAPLLARRPAGALWPGGWWDNAAEMFRIDLAAAGIPAKTADGEAVFHSLRHTFITLVGQSSPLKVLQDLARHSTPILTVGRYSHAELSEKAAAVDAIPLGGGESLPPKDILLAVLGSLFALLFVSPLVVGLDSSGDGARLPETVPAKKRKGKGGLKC